MTISPSVGTSKPASMRNSVVFPHPDGPSSAKNSPSKISRWTSCAAVTDLPKRIAMCWMEMIGRLSMAHCLLAGAGLEPHADGGHGQRNQDQDCGRCVDFGRDALPDHRIYLDREGRRRGAGSEES